MLDSIGVTNFKAFARADIPLLPFTLLSGLNSAGKSTILQLLALLRQSSDAGVLEDGDGRGLLLNGDLVELGTGRDVLHEDYVDTGSAGPEIVLRLRQGTSSKTWSAAYGSESDLLPLSSETPPGPFASRLFGKGFQYLRADRLGPAVTYPRSHETAVRKRFLGSRGEHAVNFLRHYADDLVQHESLLHPNADSPSLLHQTDAWMREICPGVNLQASGVENTDLVRLTYQFGTAGVASSQRYRSTNVGFGLSYVLPILIACLTAESDSLILLENPEAHLHPRGQTLMATVAAAAVAAGGQLIVETHSDHFLNGLRLAVKAGTISHDAVQLLYFQRNSDMERGRLVQPQIEIHTPRIGPDGMLSEWPHGFFDEWEHSLDQLLG
ncbi:DUF3696 domain-containing protein [Sphaerisporangium sp. NPDC051011]|uniref:AAA family ATPase n=1 Tax=Sphaerisporangium sp. NPDC051011 TaxID=3155792 RepID=UPI0033C3DB2C